MFVPRTTMGINEYQVRADVAMYCLAPVSVEVEETYVGNDEDGYPVVYDDPSGVDWADEYRRQHYDVEDLLAALKKMCEMLLAGEDPKAMFREASLRDMAQDADSWVMEDIDIYKNR